MRVDTYHFKWIPQQQIDWQRVRHPRTLMHQAEASGGVLKIFKFYKNVLVIDGSVNIMRADSSEN